MLQIYFEKHEILLWQESARSEWRESSVNAKVCREPAEPRSQLWLHSRKAARLTLKSQLYVAALRDKLMAIHV